MGKVRYRSSASALGIDLISDPDLLLQDEYAALSTGWFWKANNCKRFADSGDFTGLTKCINGGINGLPDRQARWRKRRWAEMNVKALVIVAALLA